MDFLQITWDAAPHIIRTEAFEIRWYGVMFALAFLLGYFFMQHVFTREKVNHEYLDRLALYLFFGALIGARLGHVFFYQPDFYLSNPAEIIKIWRGGLASHGGTIGILVSLYIFTRNNPIFNLSWVLDRLVIPVALGGALIRVGNFFNSEILGTPTNLPWAVIFERVDDIARHPAQLYEALSYIVIFGILWFLYSKWGKSSPKGFLLGLFFILLFGARFMVEFVKETYVEGLPLQMGQLLSIPFIVAGIILVWRSRK